MDTTFANYLDKDIKLVIWQDSAGCDLCRLDRLHLWHDLLQGLKHHEDRLTVLFILSTDIDDYRLSHVLRSQGLEVTYFIDRDYKFRESNPHLPKNPLLLVFLLDKNNRVSIAGNPRDNEGLWRLYEEALYEIIVNNGVIPEC